MHEPTPQTLNITPTSATALAKAILTSYGVPVDRANLIATALTLVDLRGVDTHGINPGVIAPAPDLTFNTKTPTMALLDAKNTFGFVAGSLAIDKCIEMAHTYGNGTVFVRNSNHYGMGATYVLRAIEQGLACFAYTNASPAMPPWGGAEALLGTSPFAVGVPGGGEGDFVLNMSPCVAARGKMRRAARRGESIPEGYALDAQGRPMTDPVAALEGGSGLAIMMDVFAGVMSGSAFAGGVHDQYKEMGRPQEVGHWFLVFRPDVFLDGGVEEFRERMDTLLRTVRGVKKAEGFERIYVSGEMEAEVEKKRRREGIPFTKAEVDALHYLGLQSGVQIKMEEVSK
ncbi:Malate/L-lactate dehydrogenase [Aspergillus transmontanensis]|uniref:Malate/L-lactate dehydrogenase n=1 Tax=Aspergillus transmontanensis TaxID=1034304 RepID=A0A5N6W1D3_9EURO|nr:Malate/L-lactate dehydrogenase [Aspergillus transmontanensis]